MFVASLAGCVGFLWPAIVPGTASALRDFALRLSGRWPNSPIESAAFTCAFIFRSTSHHLNYHRLKDDDAWNAHHEKGQRGANVGKECAFYRERGALSGQSIP